MKVFTEYFSEDKKVNLTGYLLDASGEMPNMENRPAVLVLPGGGYRYCSDREAEPIAMMFAAEGYQTFVLRYSVGGTGEITFDQPLNDAVHALKYIRENAEEFHVIPDKIAVIGFSAGGHLASSLGTISEEKPNALILGYPCILPKDDGVLTIEIPSTNQFVTEDTPPTFLFATSDDGCVNIEHSLSFAMACASHKVPFELHVFEHGCHGLSLSTPSVCVDGGNEAVAQWTSLCTKWLRKYFFN
ncbi:MAG TPA: alpha/beta hydrolase [Ruminococcaceae bacterium]|nr:alpha/beta hydrolase [Oscillospiraceae bacterium]